jgi:2-deoxy-D-gluconate 3-dehydrogenase
MIEQGSGKIINIASMLSYQGGITVPGYASSKHAVAGLTKALANEWAAKGLQVNAIAPGYMSTDNTEALREDPVRSAQILQRIPAGRWGTSEDLVGPAVFLASQASDYMNGHILAVDGGWLVR